MPHFQPVSLAVIQKEDRFLFTLRKDTNPDFNNKWQLPGGCMEFAETPDETLHREVREELGIEVEIVRLVPFIDVRVRGSWQGVFISYLCKMKDDDAKIYLNEEASEYKWFSPDELDYGKNNIFEGCIEIITAIGDF